MQGSSLDKPAASGQPRRMIDAAKLPADCESMIEVRAGVDATDRALMSLLEQRFAYMRAAARIKQDRATVRDESRKAEVIANAIAEAKMRELPPAAIAELWECLVEASIRYEFGEWDRLRAAVVPASTGG